jgi:hypothetical protein
MDIVACMVSTKPSTFSILFHYPTPSDLFYYGTILNTIRMEPLPILVSQYLTMS